MFISIGMAAVPAYRHTHGGKIVLKKFFVLTLLALLSMALLAPAALAAPPESGPSRANGHWYKVKAGDTLSGIAYSNGVRLSSLIYANDIKNPNHIYRGQSLWIPSKGGQHAPSSAQRYHTVRYGESLYSFGSKYDVSPWAIASTKGIYNLNLIYAGQKLYLPW
jgi:LysM repeat protein